MLREELPCLIKGACIQIGPMSADISANREANLGSIRQAFEMGANLVLLPELSSIPYILRAVEEYQKVAENLDGPTVRGWSEEARRLGIYIVGGFLEREGERLFNSAALVGPKGLIGIYRKTHLWEHEHIFFTPGNYGFPVWETPLGRLGILICFDIRFPECTRLLALKGADLICIPAGWSTVVNKNPIDHLGYTQGNYQAIAQANSSRVAILSANRAGREGPYQYIGKSLIVDASGRMIAGPGSASAPEILVGDLDPKESRIKDYGTRSNLFKDRRVDLYDEMLGYREKRENAGLN